MGIGGVTVVSVGDDWVEELVEKSVRFFVTSDGTDGLDHWVAWIVNTGLDAVTEGNTELGVLGLEFVVKTWVFLHNFSEERRVVGEVWHLVWHVTTEESGVLFGTDVFSIAATQLDPFWKGTDGFGEAGWWVIRHS